MKISTLLTIAALGIAAPLTFTSDADANWIKCADETGICRTPSGATTVRFGLSPQKSFREKRLRGNITCARPEFGGDPAAFKKKSCWYWKPTLTRCASETNICRVSKGAAATVYFARSISDIKKKRYKSKRIGANGRITCARPEFGGDPAPFKKKGCWYVAEVH